MYRIVAAAAALLLLGHPAMAGDPPSQATRAAQARAAAAGAFDDRRDFDFAARGFLRTRADPQIRTPAGQVAWDLTAYDFLKGEASASVEPGLWRQSQLLAKHGLFEVKPGIWQVRGFDIANATFVKGKTGWIVIDALGSNETARAAYELVTEELGERPITAIVYTHSHADHFGGAGGLVEAADARSGKVKVIAPDGFLEHAVAENILAGPAMARRATYQFGVFLPRGEAGQVSAGIGPGLSRGTTSLIAPNTVIKASGETLTVDGVKLEFQLTPNTEAPAEMNIYLPEFAALCMAENANATMHNVLTPRGALVRDAKVWADELTRASRLYGDRSDVMFTSHAWPRFGRAEVKDFIAKHRDAYKFLHDQSVRLMNAGLTGPEIAAQIRLPAALEREWYNHGFYGTMSFNARAVYQRYMGWYDGNPARLAPLPPETAGNRYVEAMGGKAAVTARAKAAFEAGDYAWAAELLDKLVFADPADAEAKALLARAYDQLGYQSESSLWRNIYLSGAGELRNGVPTVPGGAQGAELLASAPLSMMLDVIAVRIDPAKVGEGTLTFAVVLTDTKEQAYVSIANGVLVHEAIVAPGPVEATLTLSRSDFAGLFTGGSATLPAKIAAGEVKIDGDLTALARLAGWLERPGPPFAIVTP